MQHENPTKRGIRPAKAAEKLGVSLPTLWRYSRTVADFPEAVKLSAAVTVFDEGELDAYVERRRLAVIPQRKIGASDVKARDAASALGCRLVSDLSPAELAAWTAAGSPHRVSLGGVELVLLKAIERAAAPPAAVPVESPRKRGRPRKLPILENAGATA